MLCDFSLMPLLLRGSERDILAQFTTLTIDSRSPLKDGGVSLASDVMSSKWWKNLLRAFSSSACLGTKRLLIEGASPLEESIAIVDKARGHLNEKKSIELMAVKAAFVHHPRTFCSRRGNAGKSVIVWAKKRSRDASGNSEKEKDAALDLSGIKAELSLILEPLSHVQEMYEQPATNGITLGSPAQWEVRLCPFLPVQQAAYASSCSFVRGALSYSTLRLLSDAGKEVTPRARRNAKILWAQAMLRLRRACLHSNLGNVSSRDDHTNVPSQPQWETAKEILSNSSKMTALIALIKNECGYRIVGDEADKMYAKGAKGEQRLFL